MGEKDTISKKFMRNNERFADLFNFLYHNGEHIIKPDELLQLDTASIAATNKSGKKSEYKQRQRDVVKLLSVMAGEKETFVIFGVENQSEIDYSMPVRCLFMDMMDYVNQIERIAKKHRAENSNKTGAEFISGFHKSDKLYPVVTAVIYWGADEWDGTCSVEEMFDVSNEAYRTAIPKYTLNLVSPHDLTDTDFEKFDTELGAVLEFMKYSKDKNALKALLQREQKYRNMPRDAAEMLRIFANFGFEYKDGEENVDMCKALEDWAKESRNEGRNEGISEGIEENKIDTTVGLLSLGKLSLEEISKVTKFSIERIKEIAVSKGLPYPVS